MAKKKLRPMGEILLDIEPYLLEMVVEHDLQHSDVYGLLEKYLDAHLPEYKETYVKDGSKPIMFYGHYSRLKKTKKKV